MTVPFTAGPRLTHQRLADILLMIPGCIGLCDNMSNLAGFFSKPIPPSLDLRLIRERATELMSELSEWAERYPQSITMQNISTQVIPGLTDTALSRSPGGRRKTPVPMVTDTYVALTAATFKAAHMILSLLIHKVSPKNFDRFDPLSRP